MTDMKKGNSKMFYMKTKQIWQLKRELHESLLETEVLYPFIGESICSSSPLKADWKMLLILFNAPINLILIDLF
jgi:hypothetical protein